MFVRAEDVKSQQLEAPDDDLDTAETHHYKRKNFYYQPQRPVAVYPVYTGE